MICKLADSCDIKPQKWYEFTLQTDSGISSIMVMKNKDDMFIAFKNTCPHQGRRLDYSPGEFLLTEQGNIVCPAHGAEFDGKDGLCIGGPCKGQSLQRVLVKENETEVFAIIE